MEFHTGYRNWKLKITWDQLFDNQWTKAINGDEMLKISILFREHFFERYHTDWSMDSWINIKWLTIICSPRWMRGAPLLKYLQCTNLIRCPTMKPNTFGLIHSQNILDSTIWHAFRTPAIVVCLKTLCIEVIDQPRCRKYADAIYFFFFRSTDNAKEFTCARHGEEYAIHCLFIGSNVGAWKINNRLWSQVIAWISCRVSMT